MSKEFYERFPTLLGLHTTHEIYPILPGLGDVNAEDKRVVYVKKYYSIAQKVGKLFGINPLFILAQGAIESGWGTSNLSRNYNNFFGITAVGSPNTFWSGTKYQSTTSKLWFRTYQDAQDGFSDFARLLASKYAEAAKSKTIDQYASIISSSPYITEKNGDNRAKYRELIIKNAEAISIITKKYQSLYN